VGVEVHFLDAGQPVVQALMQVRERLDRVDGCRVNNRAADRNQRHLCSSAINRRP
jgi:hypothetical protein